LLDQVLLLLSRSTCSSLLGRDKRSVMTDDPNIASNPMFRHPLPPMHLRSYELPHRTSAPPYLPIAANRSIARLSPFYRHADSPSLVDADLISAFS